MRIQPEFDDICYNDDQYQATLEVYRQFEASPLAGQILHRAHPNPYVPGIDFVAWLPGSAHFALQVRPGTYTVKGGFCQWQWCNIHQLQPNIVDETWQEAMKIRDLLSNALNRNEALLTVLALPDMEPGCDLEHWAQRAHSNVRIIYSVNDIIRQLIDLATAERVYNRPTRASMRQGVAVLTGETDFDNAPVLTPAPHSPDPLARTTSNIASRQDGAIGRVDVVNVYNGPVKIYGLT